MPFEMQSRNVGGKTVAKELESRSVFPGGVGGWVSHTTHKYKYKYKWKYKYKNQYKYKFKYNDCAQSGSIATAQTISGGQGRFLARWPTRRCWAAAQTAWAGFPCWCWWWVNICWLPIQRCWDLAWAISPVFQPTSTCACRDGEPEQAMMMTGSQSDFEQQVGWGTRAGHDRKVLWIKGLGWLLERYNRHSTEADLHRRSFSLKARWNHT